MIVEAIKRYKKMWDEISQMFLIGSLSGITVLGDVTRKYLPVNLILLFILINMGIMLLRIYLRKKFDYMLFVILMTSGWYLTNDKAVIMIAHRLKTVQKAERIFALENGKPYSREYMKNL